MYGWRAFLTLSALMMAGRAVQPMTPAAAAVTASSAVVTLVSSSPAGRPALPPAATVPPEVAATAAPSPPTPTQEAPSLSAASDPNEPALAVASPADGPVPPAAVAPPPAEDTAAAEQYTIDLINARRTAAGVASLQRDEMLMGIAGARVADMVARGYTWHDDPGVGAHLARQMMRAAGYTSNYLGENWYGSLTGPPAIATIAVGFMTDSYSG